MFPVRFRGRPKASTAAALVVPVLGVLALVSGEGSAAPTTAPTNTREPEIGGRAEQGRTLTASRGTWAGSEPMTFAFAWVRCGRDGGRPDGGDCALVSGATSQRYVLRAADVGFRLRVRVTGTNADGSLAVASNPTAVVVGPPVNSQLPWPRGTMVTGQDVTAEPGTWTGRQPISFRYQWLRCNAAGGECGQIAGATGRSYRLTQSDAGHKVRFDLTARNAIGSRTVMSTESAVVTEPLPVGAIKLPSGEVSIPAASVPATARLVVSQVRFSPSPVTDRQAPLTVSVRVTDTRRFVVREALVFVRSTPRVTSGGDRQVTTTDGWVTYQLSPNENFPRPRRGYHVQFFVKAYRSGDPGLAGVAGYRLVQVKLAG
jgi:hypothetical protein